jgi:quercetin dioxygenase-like cupin family protein
MPAPIRAHADADQPVREVAPGVRARVRIGAGDGALGLTVADQWLEPGAAIPLHRHPAGVEQSIWVLEGEAEFTVGGETAVVGPEHTVIVPPGTEHAITAVGPGTVHLLSRFSGAPEMLGDDGEPGRSELA